MRGPDGGTARQESLALGWARRGRSGQTASPVARAAPRGQSVGSEGIAAKVEGGHRGGSLGEAGQEVGSFQTPKSCSQPRIFLAQQPLSWEKKGTSDRAWLA